MSEIKSRAKELNNSEMHRNALLATLKKKKKDSWNSAKIGLKT